MVANIPFIPKVLGFRANPQIILLVSVIQSVAIMTLHALQIDRAIKAIRPSQVYTQIFEAKELCGL